MKELTLD